MTHLSGSSGTLTRGLALLMAVSVGIVVGNLYYIQPLLGEIARALGSSEEKTGYAVPLCQAGLAFGTLFILPLGDVRDRRNLILLSCVAAAFTLGWMATSRSVEAFLITNFLLGFVSIASHIQISYAAHLAHDDNRGRAVGVVVSGLLLGIFFARIISGIVGSIIGWRGMLAVAVVLTLALAVVLWKNLPRDAPRPHLPYSRLLSSLPRLWMTERTLRQSCVYGALTFALFNAFWATATFHLEGPVFELSTRQIGLFGSVSLAGAVASIVAGHWTGRVPAQRILLWALGLTLGAYGVLWGAGGSLVAVVIGIMLLDTGIQATHVANQDRVHALDPAMRSRLHCIYMVAYFAGGALGGAIGTWAFARHGWAGVCGAGVGMAALALGYRLTIGRK